MLMLGGLLVSIGAIVRVRKNSFRYRSVWGTFKLRLELASHHFSVRENFRRTWWFWIKEPSFTLIYFSAMEFWQTKHKLHGHS